jgi:hypothetical protein
MGIPIPRSSNFFQTMFQIAGVMSAENKLQHSEHAPKLETVYLAAMVRGGQLAGLPQSTRHEDPRILADLAARTSGTRR